MRPVVIHLHVPKTAGVSLGTALSAGAPSPRVLLATPTGGIAKDFLALTNAERDARYDVLLGHDWIWGAHRLFDRPVVYVSILRHPVARIVSHYNFIHTRPANGRHAMFRAELTDLDQITRPQMVRLAVMWSNFAAALYEGRTRPLDGPTFRALEVRLREEVDGGRFVIGDAATVARILCERGLLAAPLPHLHATPHDASGAFVPARVEALSDRTRALLEAFNRWDLRLWEAFANG